MMASQLYLQRQTKTRGNKMSKLTKSQINQIIARTPKGLDGKQPTIVDSLGYFRKSGANWAYRAGWTDDGNLVVTVFGAVVTERI